jgi:ribonuclease Z
MSDTRVTLTGTGVPHAVPGRAGAGVLVQYKDVTLQFDAGRATVLRLIEAGVTPLDITALFITHYHSDHVVDLVDVVLTRWVEQNVRKTGPLRIVVPEGSAARFVNRMMDAYDDDLHVRQEHTGAEDLKIDVTPFSPQAHPTEVWRSGDGAVRVEAVLVHHEPVEGAVAYRITTPDGSVVISGDTRVCDEVFSMAADCDLLIHEACRTQALTKFAKGTPFEHIFDYHSDSIVLGEFAAKYNIKNLLLTHLIPSPVTEADAQRFEADVRAGGYTGNLTVGTDLHSVLIG